jgi:tripartite-type tricarboxylate transporter receptor subunit TctC
MEINRRRFLHLVTVAAASTVLSRRSSAQAWPSRPVHVIAGFPAGNASDIVARLVAQRLSERLGQSFVVENRPGAGGNIGTEAAAKASPDGYTLLLISPSTTINPSLYENLNFNFLRDIAPVAGVGMAPYVLVVSPTFPAKTVPEFIAYAKANPGKLNMASAGNGSLSHLCGALFMNMAGIEMVHVPYRTSFVPDVLAGQVQVVFSPLSQSIGYIRGDKLRPLAVTTASRDRSLPDVPALAEFVPGYEASGWYGIGAPKSTPTEIVERLAADIGTDLADPKMKTLLNDVGAEPMPMTSADFGKFLAAETDKWHKVVRAANIKLG